MFNRRFSLLAIATFLLLSKSVNAQTAPQIGYLFPAGAQRGSRTPVVIGGKYMPGPCGIHVGGAGVHCETQSTTGNVTLTVDEDAASGPRAIRIHSVQGASAPRAFIVGVLPELLEDSSSGRQSISPRVTINGRLHPKGDIDEYGLTLSAGQQIVCSVAMRSLGSPGDSLLRLIDAHGRVLVTSSEHRKRDPLLVWSCPEAGQFVLQILNFNLAGGEDHVYRLTVTDGPFLDYAFPPGIQQGVTSEVTLHGWNLPGESLKHTVESSERRYTTQIHDSANQVTLPVGHIKETQEREPNDVVDAPQVVDGAVVINGRFQTPGDVDVFRFPAQKGERLVVRVESERLGFPADAVLQVLKSDGQLIRETDDVRPSRDPQYLFTAPADGEYMLSVRERAGRGGPRFVYRLHLGPQKPSLRLTVKAGEFAIVPGETLTIPVRVEPVDGFDQEVELAATDLPEGVTVEPVKHVAKKAGNVSLKLEALPDAGFTSGPFRIIARSTAAESQPVELTAARLTTSGALPPDSVSLWLAVSPRVPFTLSTTTSIQEAPRLAGFPFPVTITRDEGFQSAIRLVGVDPDRRGTVVPLTGQIAADSDTGSIPLIIQSEAIEGTTHRCRVMGVAEIAGRDGKLHSVFHVAKGSMAMGCQPNLLSLTTTPDRIRFVPGQSATVTVTVDRHVPCGDVMVALMPGASIHGVTMQPVRIGRDIMQSTLTLEIPDGADLPPEFQIPLQASASRDGLPVYARSAIRLLSR